MKEIDCSSKDAREVGQGPATSSPTCNLGSRISICTLFEMQLLSFQPLI